MKLIACMSVYNEIQFIKRVLRGLEKNGIDHVIAVDGAYQGFPHEAWQSTDGTEHELIKWPPDWMDIVSAPMDGWPGQEIKRTAYFRAADKIAEPGDWLIQVDGDEELVEDGADYRGFRIRDFIAGLPEHVNTIYVSIRNFYADKEPGNFDYWAKVYRWLPGLHYGHEHWDVLGGNGERVWDLGLNFQSREARVWPHFKFHHWTDSRSKERLDAKSEYENYRAEYRRQHTFMNPEPSIEVKL